MKRFFEKLFIVLFLFGLYSCEPDDFVYYNDVESSDGSDDKRIKLRLIDETDTTIVFEANGSKFCMVKVEGGNFMMGAQSSDETGANYDPQAKDEGPVHEVTLSSFCIGQTEVTEGLWAAVMEGEKANSQSKMPKSDLTIADVDVFVNKLNFALLIDSNDVAVSEKFSFSLPSEAQWEYAARGGNKSRGYVFSGSASASDVAWCEEDGASAHEVGLRDANELGIYDMSGNLSEWCADKCDSVNCYLSMDKVDPIYPFGNYFVVRSGSFSSASVACRVSARSYSVSSCYDNIGLRLVATKQ